jgi:hypothetical protein
MKRCLLLAFLAMPSWADIVVDQSFISGGPDFLSAPINPLSALAQTYTAGLTGTLAGVNIDVSESFGIGIIFPLRVQIQSVSGGIPTGNVLGDITLGTDNSPLSSLIMFPELVPQVAGTQYAIVVDYPTVPSNFGAPPGRWAGNTGDQYPGGQLRVFSSQTQSWTIFSADDDLHFQTFVVIPEPSTGMLILITAVVVSGAKFAVRQFFGLKERVHTGDVAD